MGTNKKGEQTKEYIYYEAKKLFYELGYKSTTLSKIAEIAQVPIGLIPYHFTNKDTIVSLIYQELIDNIRNRLKEREDLNLDNSILFHAVVSRIYHQIILSDENNRRFYYEILQKKSNYKILNRVISQVYRDYMKDFQMVLAESDFQDIVHADFGARREFFLHHLGGKEPLDIQKMVTFANAIVPRLLRMNPVLVDNLMAQSLEVYQSVDFSDIKFLV